ncbi:nickel-dependent hydrogenase large subunit [Thermodesulfobacteriota bacterium]
MSKKKIQIYPLNRVEGDLEIHIEVEDGVVAEAWSAGTMYRGFENLLIGRAVLDGLVITPRICGICSTSHLKAAAKALDMVFNVKVPDNAKRIRNVTLIAEQIQSDFRHAFLIFMSDFTNPVYEKHPLYAEAVRRYEPLKGETTIQAIQESKKILEIIAILGGQWPHSSFMVPGGVVSMPSPNELTQCQFLLNNFRKWFENRVLGCGIDRWMEVKCKSDLDAWLDEAESHAMSDLGFYIRFAKKAGLENMGRGHGNFISFGSLDLPENTDVKGFNNNSQFLSAGFSQNCKIEKFNHEKIKEDVSYSWFHDYANAKHPFDGVTNPYATGKESGKYSWAKAPRYDGMAAETGPLAEMVTGSNPLFMDIIKSDGPNVFNRELARLVRTAFLIPVMEKWLEETALCKEAFYRDYEKIENGEGFGLIEAPRGSLGHWVKIKDAKIEKYQIITPTAWNASPRDANGIRGPWEEAIVGTEIKDKDNPIEVGHIVRSFDACLVCAVHTINIKKPPRP